MSLYGIIFVKKTPTFFPKVWYNKYVVRDSISQKGKKYPGPGFVPPSGFQGLITSITTVNRQTYSSVSGFNIVDSLPEERLPMLRQIVGGTNIQKGKDYP